MDGKKCKGKLNHKWHGPLLAFYHSWLSSCNQPWLIVYRPASVCQCQSGWRPYTAFNLGTALPDYRWRKFPRMLPAQVLNLRWPWDGRVQRSNRQCTAHTLRSGLSLQPPYHGPLTRQPVKTEAAKNKLHSATSERLPPQCKCLSNPYNPSVSRTSATWKSVIWKPLAWF